MSTLVRKRLINSREYHEMGETGMFQPDEKIELINGEIYTKCPIGSKHAAVVELFSDLLESVIENKFKVRTQNPVRLGEFNELQPDLVVLDFRQDYYASSHPVPGDVHLIVEVSDATYDFDRNVKLPIYSSAGIPAYWIINLNKNFIKVFEEPREEFYKKTTRYGPGDTISFQGKSIDVSQILIAR